MILDNDGDVNQPNKDGFYQLEYVFAISKKESFVQVLLETKKVDLNQKIYKYEDDSNEKFLVTYLLLAAASSISKIPKILLDLNVFDVNMKHL